MILADSGYWIALIDRGDRHHRRALEVSRGLDEGLLTTWPVLTETCHFLGARHGPRAVAGFLQLGASGGYQLHAFAPTDLPRLQVLVTRHADLPMDLADASLLLLAELRHDGRILSTDRRDFQAYRFKNREPFQNLLLPD